MERAHEELLQTALIQEREGFWADAFRISFRLKRLYPEDARVLALVEALEKKRIEEFLNLEAEVRRPTPPTPSPSAAGAWIEVAQRFCGATPEALHEDLCLFFLALGDPVAALCFLEKKQSVNFLYLRAWCLLALRKFEDARALLKGQEVSALRDYLLARSYEREGRSREARLAYQRAGNYLDARLRYESLQEDGIPE